jgi:hypothetical protein
MTSRQEDEMTKSWCRWMWIVALVGCGGTGAPPIGGDDIGDDSPDAEPEGPVCVHDSCGLPGDDPCCSDTTCVDWDILGPTECASECAANSDCDTGCCVELTNGQHACAPEGACDAGGVTPEYLCQELVACDVTNNYNGCVDSITTCVGNLTQDQQRSWLNAMQECGSPGDASCSDGYVYCWANYVPWC